MTTIPVLSTADRKFIQNAIDSEEHKQATDLEKWRTEMSVPVNCPPVYIMMLAGQKHMYMGQPFPDNVMRWGDRHVWKLGLEQASHFADLVVRMMVTNEEFVRNQLDVGGIQLRDLIEQLNACSWGGIAYIALHATNRHSRQEANRLFLRLQAVTSGQTPITH